MHSGNWWRRFPWRGGGSRDRLAHQHLSGQRDHGAFLWAVMVLAGFLARAPGGPSLR